MLAYYATGVFINCFLSFSKHNSQSYIFSPVVLHCMQQWGSLDDEIAGPSDRFCPYLLVFLWSVLFVLIQLFVLLKPPGCTKT